MNDLIVKFIDKEYVISKEVLTYIDLLKFTDNVQKTLASAFVRKLKNEIAKDNIGLLGDEDLASEIEQQIGKFIAKLCDNGIFTRTISDYLKGNKGYQLYSDVNKSALEKTKSILIQEMDAWQAGYENAVNKAESNITGMGFSIWSGSFVNHAIYAAMEASTINKQEKEAQAQYQKDMNDLRSRLDSQYGGEKSNYINNTYIPNMEAALTVFAYELLDKYVNDLIANNKFDRKTLEFVDISRSNDLLKNLTLSENKKAILENAFIACPYNIAVYMQAMKYELLDFDSFQTARIFKQSDEILSFLKSSWGEVSYPTKFNINYHCIDMLSLFTEKSATELLHSRTEQYVVGIVKAYSRVADMLDNKDLCYKVIREFDDTSILAGNAISKGKAHSYVDSIVTPNIWNQLIDKCGQDDLLEKIKVFLPADVQLQSKAEIDDFLIEKITVNFEEARQDIIEKINLKREEDEKNRIEEEKRKAATVELRKKRTKQVICLGCIAISIALILLLASSLINSHMQKKEKERIYQEKIATIENQVNSGEYEEAVNSLIYSDLSEEQKQKYYNSLVDKIHYKSFEVNGLIIKFPEHWSIKDYSDPNIESAYYSKSDTYYVSWYVKCMGTAEQVARDGDDAWRKDNDYSSASVAGCEDAYIRCESNKKVDDDKVYSVIDYYVICQGFVYEIQYFAYDERFFEPEMQMLLQCVEFERFADAEIQANRKEETYLNANNLLEDGEYEEAIALFEQLGEYKDSKELMDTAVLLQLQQIEDYKASCTEVILIDDLSYVSSIDVKVYAQVKKHIRNDEYYIITEHGETIQIWNRSSKEELIEGEWVTVYGNAYGHGDNMTIRVEYIED